MQRSGSASSESASLSRALAAKDDELHALRERVGPSWTQTRHLRRTSSLVTQEPHRHRRPTSDTEAQ